MEDNEIESLSCALCDTALDEDNTHVTENDDSVCDDCVISCERCSGVFDINDEMNTIDDREIWCNRCTRYNATCCGHCNEYTSGATMEIYDRSMWCEDCTDSYAMSCGECDEYYVDECRCEEMDMDCGRVIHDYSYSPDPRFHTNDRAAKLFLGVEIEVEARGNRGEAADYAYTLEGLGLAYLKSDGSLECGFEVVSHPMTHDYWMNDNQEFFDVIERLRTQYKVKSWDTRTCGFHIHLSRAGFNNGSHMHRFLNLIYSTMEFYEAIAGRSSERWAKFDDIERTERWWDNDMNLVSGKTKRSFINKIENGMNTDRYSAVNTQNPNTLEIRIFRGTVNGETIKAFLDIAQASVEYTRVMSVKQVIDGSLHSDRFIEYIHENAELYPHIKARIAKVWKYPTQIIPASASRQEASI